MVSRINEALVAVLGRSRLFDDETLFYGFALVSLSVIRVLGRRQTNFHFFCVF
jgi:hypothetical protein